MVLKILQRAFREGVPVTGDLGFLAAFTGVLVLSIGVAMLSFRLVETPGINLGKRVVRKLCPS
jgi:peptidoglycan/LPS O-acetylase OafA/YrhL